MILMRHSYSLEPFTDVAHSLYQVYFSARTDEESAHVKVRKTAVQCVVDLYYDWNDMTITVNNP